MGYRDTGIQGYMDTGKERRGEENTNKKENVFVC
jgi:hypothetical protein